MRNEPTGSLIGVIGDDNDDFLLIGTRRDFVAQRDGVLFLGVNEGNLADNRAQRAQNESLHVFPSGYHTTLPVQEISRIPY